MTTLALTSEGIAEAETWLHKLAENLSSPEAREYVALAIAAAREKADGIAKHRSAARDELLRYIAREHFTGVSALGVSAEIRAVASRFTNRRPLSAPASIVWRVVELSGGKCPSDRTIRNAIRK